MQVHERLQTMKDWRCYFCEDEKTELGESNFSERTVQQSVSRALEKRGGKNECAWGCISCVLPLLNMSYAAYHHRPNFIKTNVLLPGKALLKNQTGLSKVTHFMFQNTSLCDTHTHFPLLLPCVLFSLTRALQLAFFCH